MTTPRTGGQPSCEGAGSGFSLEHSSALGRLAGGIAHDFNNLLTVILSNLDLLHVGNLRDGEVCLRQIREAAESGARLARQLQVFSRVRATSTVTFSLNDLLEDVCGLLQRLIEERIQLTVTMAPDLCYIRGDRAQFEQLLLNLALNARDAINGNGALSITTANVIATPDAGKTPGPYVVLTVSDDGAGMDAATQARVFEPYFSTKSGLGTGLGLTTVAEVVKQSHGHIHLRSAPGEGTTFKIFIPVAEQPAEVSVDERLPACSPGSAPSGRGHAILIVEDNSGVRAVVQRTLTLLDYRVIVASTPAEGLRISESLPEIDLLITDLIMPGMSGSALARVLKSRRPGMAVLYISGYGEPTAEDLIDGAGYLAKPFLDQALARLVTQLLAGRTPAARSGTTSSS